MKPTIPPAIAPIPAPTRSTSAAPVKVTTPPDADPVPVAGGAVLVTFLGWPVNEGPLLVGGGDADEVIFGAVVVGTTVAEALALEVLTGIVLLA